MSSRAAQVPEPASSVPLRGQASVFDEDFLKKLELLSLLSRRLIAGQFKAERRARKLGSGLEFADYRGYVPGDDYRKVDWRAYLRLDRLILRLFEEEADLPIYIFLDCSASMSHGQIRKLDYARKVAAALAYIGLANLDGVSLVAYANGVVDELHSLRGKSQIFKIFRFLSSIRAANQTAAEDAFCNFFTSRRRRGLTVVISDLFDPNGVESALDALRYRKQDLLVIHVVSPEDARPGLNGELTLVDAETKDREDIRATPDLLQLYAHEFDAYCGEIERYCTLYGFGYVRTLTNFAFEDLILQVLRQGRFVK